MQLSPLNQRRWRNFRANRRAFWSLIVFTVLFGLSLVAELIANDKPILVSYRGELYAPVFYAPYEETDFGGDPGRLADFSDPVVQCLIRAGGIEDCFDDPAGVQADAADGELAGTPVETGWIVFPPIPYAYNTIDKSPGGAVPVPPSSRHLLGTDDQSRDVVARVIYGFRISILFALVVAVVSSLIGITAGAVQGFFGGWVDLTFQRIVEIWTNMPTLYIIIILSAMIQMTFGILTTLIAIFSWTSLVGVVRAEFLRARNFEYVRAARALGVTDATIMRRHILPNAMVATLTMLPFIITGAIGGLAALDYLGFGLPPSYPSLGELALQGKNNINDPWLGFTAFFTFSIMLSLLVFIFEGVRDAFDPRKTFQ